MELGSAAAVKDRVRDVGWEHVLESTWQDVRYAARTLRRSPVFTAVTVAALALGIGANTAMFSVINTLMLRALPVSHPEQLVELLSVYPGEPRTPFFWWRHYEHFRDRNQSFSDLLAVARSRFNVSGDGLEPEAVEGEYVAGNVFTALDVRPFLGRVIDAADDQVGACGRLTAHARMHLCPQSPSRGTPGARRPAPAPAASAAQVRRQMPDPIPVMIIGRLAVDTRHQGHGLGYGFLRDALLRTLQVATGLVSARCCCTR